MGDAEEVGRVCWSMGHHLDWRGGWVEAADASRRGLIALKERVAPDRCRLLALAGRLLSWSGSYAGGSDMVRQAVSLAEDIGDERLLGEVLLEKNLHHWDYSEYREQAEAGQRGLRLLRPSGALWELAGTLWTTQSALTDIGRFDEATKLCGELEPLATRLGHEGALFFARRGRAERDLAMSGDLDRFQKAAKDDLEWCHRADMELMEAICHLALARAYFLRGRWEEAAKEVRKYAGTGGDEQGVFVGGEWALEFGLRAYAGERDAVLAMFNTKRGDLTRGGERRTLGAPGMLFAAVEGLAGLREKEEAARLYPLVLEASDTVALYGINPLPQTVAGIAASAGGLWEKAEKHCQTAFRQAQELPDKIGQPEVRRWYARMLIDRDGPGDRERARELLTEATAMYRKIGMPKHVEMAEAMLGEL